VLFTIAGLLMDRHEIVREIQRTVQQNNGQPLGAKRFQDETGIKESDWFGKYWRNWGDALLEAGFRPNQMQAAYNETALIKALLDLIRELGRFPVKADPLLKRRRDASFPSHNVFTRCFGGKPQRVAKLLEFCHAHSGFEDIVAVLESIAAAEPLTRTVSDASHPEPVGFVYLVRHGSRREYKIGKTINPIRREGEIGLELPLKVKPEHVIKTDDPAGIERYWHDRFADKRMNGEWFALSTQDVRAFKKWRRIS